MEVKSTSRLDSARSDSRPSAFSQVQEALGRLPQKQVSPVTSSFSVAERSQVHWPTGRAPIQRLADFHYCAWSRLLLTARASGTGGGILSRRLLTAALEGTILAAGALGLSGTDAGTTLGGLAAGGGGMNHFELKLEV